MDRTDRSSRDARPATLPVGERGLLVELADNDAVQRLFASVDVRRDELELVDAVPGHTTLLLVGAHRRPTLDAIDPGSAPRADGDDGPRPHVHLTVRYDGPDLHAVADCCGVSLEELVRRHRAPTYRVAFIGFAPGFGYLVGGDPALTPPRRESPRVRVPPGSLAIAGDYTAVYPVASPGGWHLIGSCETAMFDADGDPPSLLSPGIEVSLRTPC